MKVTARLQSIRLADRILTNRLQYQTACLRGLVSVVEQAELRIKLELDVLITVRFLLHVFPQSLVASRVALAQRATRAIIPV